MQPMSVYPLESVEVQEAFLDVEALVMHLMKVKDGTIRLGWEQALDDGQSILRVGPIFNGAP